MRIIDIIDKKKRNQAHSKEEIDFLIHSLMDGTAADYQISAWLMSVYFNSMSEDETAFLTEAMINSGEKIDLKELSKSVVDKHSTGGVGDKVTLTLIPLLAACGVPVVKMSGKGLGILVEQLTSSNQSRILIPHCLLNKLLNRQKKSDLQSLLKHKN